MAAQPTQAPAPRRRAKCPSVGVASLAFSLSGLALAGINSGGTPLLEAWEKPFTPSTLTQNIRKVLGLQCANGTRGAG